MVSLHATKVVHAIEGGFIAATDPTIREKVEWMRRFGHKGDDSFYGVGINAKMSEFHAAMGLCNLNHIDKIWERRKAISDAYDKAFLDSNLQTPRPLAYRPEATRNYAYYPIIFESEEQLLGAVSLFESNGIYPRRYFFPALDQVPEISSVDQCSQIATCVSKIILCLPLSASMNEQEAEQICKILKELEEVR